MQGKQKARGFAEISGDGLYRAELAKRDEALGGGK